MKKKQYNHTDSFCVMSYRCEECEYYDSCEMRNIKAFKNFQKNIKKHRRHIKKLFKKSPEVKNEKETI